MKKKTSKILSVLLLSFFVLFAFAGCGNSGPKAFVLESFTYYWLGDETTYTVDNEMKLDEYGRLASLNKQSDLITFTYDENGALVRADVAGSDGEQGYETWTYADGLPVSSIDNPNDGFRSRHDVTFSNKVDGNGYVTELVADEILTDAEDGSKERQEIKYTFTYDAEGRVETIRYYSDKELDHTTVLSYDENGNLVTFSNIGADDGEEYLRFEYNYKEADAVEADSASNFTKVLNWEYLINHIL